MVWTHRPILACELKRTLVDTCTVHCFWYSVTFRDCVVEICGKFCLKKLKNIFKVTKISWICWKKINVEQFLRSWELIFGGVNAKNPQMLPYFQIPFSIIRTRHKEHKKRFQLSAFVTKLELVPFLWSLIDGCKSLNIKRAQFHEVIFVVIFGGLDEWTNGTVNWFRFFKLFTLLCLTIM